MNVWREKKNKETLFTEVPDLLDWLNIICVLGMDVLICSKPAVSNIVSLDGFCSGKAQGKVTCCVVCRIRSPCQTLSVS